LPYILRLDVPSHIQIMLLEKIADIEHRLSTTASDRIQSSGLVATFQLARQMIAKEAPDQEGIGGNDHEEMDIA